MIPWDDDIDIGVLLEDFQKLKNINWDSYGLENHGLDPNNIGKITFKNYLNNNVKNQGVFIDVFVMEEKEGKIQYAYEYARKTWPKEYFLKDEVFPLKRYKFGNTILSGPKEYEPYLKRSFGNWKKPMVKLDKKILYPLDTLKMYLNLKVN